jgi:hypothetical protein
MVHAHVVPRARSWATRLQRIKYGCRERPLEMTARNMHFPCLQRSPREGSYCYPLMAVPAVNSSCDGLCVGPAKPTRLHARLITVHWSNASYVIQRARALASAELVLETSHPACNCHGMTMATAQANSRDIGVDIWQPDAGADLSNVGKAGKLAFSRPCRHVRCVLLCDQRSDIREDTRLQIKQGYINIPLWLRKQEPWADPSRMWRHHCRTTNVGLKGDVAGRCQVIEDG